MGIPFELALAQTIAWCGPRADPADPAGSLRSTELRPQLLAAKREHAVSSLVTHRSYADAPTKAAVAVGSRDDLVGGRLLAYFPDEELSDGAAEVETRGFFDAFNAPPWDTWVGLFEDDRENRSPYLVSWVPPAFIDLASAGIWVNPEECIVWLDAADVPLSRTLRQRGLLA